jgi:hypothetical protein
MANGWTLERRRRQAELIWQWQPWTRSTGPTSEAGKSRSKMNAVTHGGATKEMRTLRASLAKQQRQMREFLDRLERLHSDVPSRSP